MEYVLYFFKIIFYTLGTVCLCGLIVAMCESLFKRLLGGGMGNGVILITSIIGTPVHESGHAIMCLLFGHKISKMSLWNPKAKDGTLGYVTHSYDPHNIYHRFGNLFIALGPIFSGLAVMTLMLVIAFPQTLSDYLSAAAVWVDNGDGSMLIWIEGMKMIPRMFAENSVELWLKILAVLVMLSVSLHITLSPADIKGGADALPIYLGGVLIFTVITSLMGTSVMGTVSSALALYSTSLMSLFVIVLVFSVALVILAFVIYIIRCAFKTIFLR